MTDQRSTAVSNGLSMFLAIELSRSGWLVAIQCPSDGRVSRHKLAGGDIDGLLALIGRARSKAERMIGSPVETICCHEAGYDGFWIHRRLEAAGVISHVIDPASLQVDRRARRIKTDAIDVEALLRALMAYRPGETGICRMVRPPTVEQEDARRLHRERHRLIKERVAHVNRIKGLLVTQGIYDFEPLRASRRDVLDTLTTHDGRPVPPHLKQEVLREIDRLELALKQIHEVEAERDAVAATETPRDGAEIMIGQLMRLRSVGPETATVLVREVFYREFANRREVAAYAGLTPSPYRSGGMNRDQGISKAGNALVRAKMVELAWMWMRYQPESALAHWFVERVGAGKGRVRRIGIVAVARKLLVALWRYVTTGLVPSGAQLKPGQSEALTA
jgi:transposase